MDKKNQNSLIAWECRYFLSTLTENFSSKNLASIFHRRSGSLEEDDIYLFRNKSQANIKFRKRTNILKLKTRIEQRDGFELWKTVFQQLLPILPDKCEVISKQLGFASLEKLAGISTIDQILETIKSEYPDMRCLNVRKKRNFYRRGFAQLEVSRVYIKSEIFFSIQFESENLLEAQILHKKLFGGSLGQPKSFVAFCLENLEV